MANKTISIGFKLDDNGQGLKTLTMDADALRKAMGSVVEEAGAMHQALVKTGAESFGWDAIKSSIGEITSMMQELSDAYAVQEAVERKLETVMRERMDATDQMIQGIKDLASEQQQLGVIGDEVQLAGAQQMATFLETEGALRTLIPAMNNLVAQQKGLNATQGDAVTVGNLMGKVMQGQTSALKKVGITFSEAQKEALEFGTEEERAAILADIITQNVGNMNAELAKTTSGKFQQLANAIGDTKEQFGQMAQKMLPAMTMLNQMIMLGSNLGKVRGAVIMISGAFKQMFTNAKLASAGTNGLTTSTNLASVAMGKLRIIGVGCFKALKAALISTGVGVALFLIGEALGFIYTKMTQTASATEDLADAMDDVAAAAQAGESALKQQQAQFNQHLATLKTFKGSKEEEKRLCEELNNTYGETFGIYNTASEWYKVLSNNAKKYSEMLILQAKAQRLAAEAADKDLAVDKWEKHLKEVQQLQKEMGNNPLLKNSDYRPDAGLDSVAQAGLAQAKKEQEAAHIALEKNMEEQSKLGSQMKTGPGKGGSGKPKNIPKEPPPPEGSIAYYENLIAEIDKKIKKEVDLGKMAQLERQKAALQKEIDAIQKEMAPIIFRIKFDANKDGFADKIKKDIQDTFLSDPIPLKVAVDTDGLTKELAKVPEGFRVTKPLVKDLNKDLNDIANVCGKAGQAFASMGEAFEMPALNIMGIIAQAIAQMVMGYASATAKSGSLSPWGWLAFSLTGLAELTAMISQVKNISKFADGGIVSGPTMALVGEYAGASNNPEVIAPLNKLRSMIGPASGAQTVVVGGNVRVKGKDLVIALRNQKAISGASGKNTI